MSDDTPKVGTIAWQDLTVDDAEAVRDFYKDVVGWNAESVGMDGYSDFNMVPPAAGEAVAGICHARASNADLPAQWLIYFVVADADASAACCQAGGGDVIVGPRDMGSARFCVIRDPAGAVCALYSAGEPSK